MKQVKLRTTVALVLSMAMLFSCLNLSLLSSADVSTAYGLETVQKTFETDDEADLVYIGLGQDESGKDITAPTGTTPAVQDGTLVFPAKTAESARKVFTFSELYDQSSKTAAVMESVELDLIPNSSKQINIGIVTRLNLSEDNTVNTSDISHTYINITNGYLSIHYAKNLPFVNQSGWGYVETQSMTKPEDSKIDLSKAVHLKIEPDGSNLFFVFSQGEEAYSYKLTYNHIGNTSPFNFAFYNLSSEQAVDNVKYTFNKDFSKTETVKSFLESNKEILEKQLSQVTVEDETAVNTAIAQISLMEEKYQYALKEQQKYLNQLKNKINQLSLGTMQEGELKGYFVDGFTAGNTDNWEVIQGTGEYTVEQKDNENVLSVKASGSPNFLIAPKSGWLQDGNFATMVTYKLMRKNGLTSNKMYFYYSYTDQNNYKAVTMACAHSGDKTYSFGHIEVTNGVVKETGYYNWGGHNIGIDFGRWFDVMLIFVDGEFIFRATQDDTVKFEKSGMYYDKAAVMLNATEQVWYDGFAVKYFDEDGYSQLETTQKDFKTTFTQELKLKQSTYSSVSLPNIEKALTYYQSLIDDEKLMLRVENQTLINNKAAIEALGVNDDALVRADDDYSDFTENFETGMGMRKFVHAKSKQLTSTAETVYDEEKASNVVKLKGEGAFVVKNEFLPELMALKKVSFDYKVGEGNINATWPIELYIEYMDENNYAKLTFYPYTLADGAYKYRARYIYYKDGQQIINQSNFNFNVDLEQWSKISYIYTNNDVTVEFASMDGEEVSAFSFVRRYYGCNFGFSAAMYNTSYYDNIVATMQKGDWDVDEENTDIVVYYSGNTTLIPGDAVMLYGENIYNTVKSASVIKLDNTVDAVGNEKYVYETWEDSSGVKGIYSDFSNPLIDVNNDRWNTDAIALEFIQKTPDSIKFILPEELDKGIYAIRLMPKNAGRSPIIVYINNPLIDSVMGDQGEIATQGGTIRITGKAINLSEGNEKVKVALRDVNGNSTELNISEYSSEYSVVADIPYDLSFGEYEVLVYNGYGDETAWSIPNKITIGEDPRNLWKSTVYNLKDFGAIGDRDQNATPIFARALATLEANGGGTLYIPAGIYHLVHSLVIPENVRLIGEGSTRTTIVWSPDRWDFGELPPYMIAITSDVEINGISFQGQRTGWTICIYGDGSTQTVYGVEDCPAKNIYFNDIYIYRNCVAGDATNAGGVVTRLYTDTELFEMVFEENYGSLTMYRAIYSSTGVGNIELKNIRIENANFECAFTSFGDGYYGRTENIDFYSDKAIYSLPYHNSYYINSVVRGGAYGQLSDGMYYHNVTFSDVRDNNREVAVADGTAYYGREGDGQIEKVEDGGKNITYRVTNRTFTAGHLVGDQIFVLDGQGKGQTRRITSSVGGTGLFTVDNPFTIEPNRNSRIVIGYIRADGIYSNCTFKNGLAGGFYGRYSDIVYDNCTHIQNGNYYFNAYGGDPNWYLTIQNASFEECYVFHSYGWGENEIERSGYAWLKFIAHTPTGTNANIGTTVKNCYFDTMTLEINGGTVQDGYVSMIIDNNVFENVPESAILIKSYATDFNGMLFYRNEAINCGSLYSANLLAATSVRNTVRSSRFIIYDIGETNVAGDIIGDVNGDGEITLKDCTILRYYLIGKVSLTDRQLARADVFGDGNVSMRTITQIRLYLIGQIDTVTGTMTGEREEDASSNISSEDTSSIESSGDTSSDISSSEDSSSSESTSSNTWFPGRY